MEDTTKWGVPKGSVAKKLRTILYPELTEHEVEAIIVILMAHLLVEQNLNGLLYRWLRLDIPVSPEEEERTVVGGDLWKNIVDMDFAKKYSLVEPYFRVRFPEEASKPWKINNLRNHIFHGKKAFKDAKFEGQPISEESAVEKIFYAAQSVSRNFDKFEEMLDGPHAVAER